MEITSNNFCSTMNKKSYANKKNSFGSAADNTLPKILRENAIVLPERMLLEVKKLVSSKAENLPTLKDLHLNVYSKLENCKTLDEVKKLFSEFEVIKDAKLCKWDSRIKSLPTITEKVKLEDLSLWLIKKAWLELKTYKEIWEELGLSKRSQIQGVLDKINFVNRPHNYITLINASDEIGNNIIAIKQKNWNQLHPDLMQQRNKHAAQFCKTPKYRKAQSQRMIEYDKIHPERRKKIGDFFREVWSRADKLKEAKNEFKKTQPDYVKAIVNKAFRKEDLNDYERRILGKFFNDFFNARPDMKGYFGKIARQVSQERKMKAIQN